MRKYIYSLFMAVAAVTLFTACSGDEGTEPGTDSNPAVTLYQYTVAKPYDSDTDTELRIAANSKTKEAYVLCESTSDYQSRLSSLGENGYNDYVVKNGEKVEGISGASIADKYFTGLKGDNTITVVAVSSNGKMSGATATFTALSWTDVCTGTYQFGAAGIKNVYAAQVTTTLQVAENAPGTYRFKDLFGTGYSMKFTLTGDTGSDADGNYKITTVKGQGTGLAYGSYGELYVRDVATWQNSSDYLAYNTMYEDNTCVFWMQYYVSAGNTGYAFEYFFPNAE